MDLTHYCKQAGIDESLAQAWVDAGWVRPRGAGSAAEFSSIDVARAKLIQDLCGPLGVNDEGVGVILDLLDQIHGLRHALRGVTTVIATQEISVRGRIRSDVRKIIGYED